MEKVQFMFCDYRPPQFSEGMEGVPASVWQETLEGMTGRECFQVERSCERREGGPDCWVEGS